MKLMFTCSMKKIVFAFSSFCFACLGISSQVLWNVVEKVSGDEGYWLPGLEWHGRRQDGVYFSFEVCYAITSISDDQWRIWSGGPGDYNGIIYRGDLGDVVNRANVQAANSVFEGRYPDNFPVEVKTDKDSRYFC
ncbi:MAG: hypothetical protein MJ240_07575 [Kiritimatiellae bacterium]|nr:hypothetical protein [Kiritimatiellia bacterium]